jgi:hypothetical protein
MSPLGILSFFLILWLNNIKGIDMNGRELGLSWVLTVNVLLILSFYDCSALAGNNKRMMMIKVE